jgi:hypothetical protein
VAVVFLALNGDGLGHLVRTTIIADALARVGEHPVIFSQGIFPLPGANFSGKQVPSLWKADAATRHRVGAELLSMAAISLPAIVVEDTHPNPIALPKAIRRVLVVRPTSFAYLQKLNRLPYSTLLLCDAPNSPTWPYSEPETVTLLAWPRWHIIGPVYRRPTGGDMAIVRERYRLTAEQRLCIFSMGGGGGDASHPDANDSGRFVVWANEIAERLAASDPRTRLIFVKGPYFPAGAAIGTRFEIVAEEPQMPALLAAADGAIVRAGYNTPWECIAGETPFLPFLGTTFGEPVRERLRGMAAQGLLAPDFDHFWLNAHWREEFRRNSRRVVGQHGGRPEPVGLRDLILGQANTTMTGRGRTRQAPQRIVPSPRRPQRGRAGAIPLVIRIDDVVAPEPALIWLLKTLAARRFRAALEVVPYLAQFDESHLDALDPGAALFEVGQHGYAHIPRSDKSGRRCEFSPQSLAPASEEIAAIGAGRARLCELFPRRFKGGFSPAYDALPRWLPELWRGMSGTFISCVAAEWVRPASLPIIRAGIDIWDWSIGRTLPRPALRQHLAAQAVADGYVGLVLHPRCLRGASHRGRLVALLDYLEARGVATISLHDLARPRGDGTSLAGKWLWAIRARIAGRL